MHQTSVCSSGSQVGLDKISVQPGVERCLTDDSPWSGLCWMISQLLATLLGQEENQAKKMHSAYGGGRLP